MSGTIVRVKGFGYYDKKLKRSDSAGLDMTYWDNENEVPGRWKTFTAANFNPKNFTPIAENGAKVETAELQALTKGKHPVTDELMVSENIAKDKKRSIAVDFTLSAPKPVSVMWGTAKAEAAVAGPDSRAAYVARKIEEIHRRAVDRALQYAFDEGWVVAREGKGGRIKKGAGHVAASQWDHFTSRSGDPQLHTHSVFANACYRANGSTGAIDSQQLFAHKGEVSAIYRTEMCAGLKEELGLSVSKEDRNFGIDGFNDRLTTTFSKGRNKVLGQMADWGFEGTAENRKAAQMANLLVRQDKSEQPHISVLANRWKMEAGAVGENFQTIDERTQHAAKIKREKLANDLRIAQENAKLEGREIPSELSSLNIEALSQKVLKSVTETEAAFEERTFRRLILEELQVHVNADQAIAIYETIKAETAIVKIGEVKREPIYTTVELHNLELELLQRAQRMQGNVKAVDTHLVRELIAKGRVMDEATGEIAHYRAEQAEMIEHFFGPNQLDIENGDPGTGKSFGQAGVKEIAEHIGFRVHALAPSWKAVDVLKKDTGVEDEYARAITGWINAVRKGDLVVDRNTFILVDEAGMVGHAQMNDLLKIAEETGARIKLIGDYKQLQPVAAGGSLRALIDVIDAKYMIEINRQKVDWQLQASKDASRGDWKACIDAYDSHGNMHWCDDSDDALSKAVAKWLWFKENKPHQTVGVFVDTNQEAAAVHERIQQIQIAKGELRGPVVTLNVVTFGKTGRVTEKDFQAGMRIALGESLKIENERFANKATGVIEEIIAGDEPGTGVITIKFDDGRVKTFSTKDLVGFRERGADSEGVPKIAHADAMTTHMGQGVTMDNTIKVSLSGQNAEKTLVAKTRGRWDHHEFVDAGRIFDELSVSHGVMIRTDKDGNTTEADDTGDTPITLDQIKKRYIEEVSKSSGKMNVSDFQPDRKEWARNTKPIEIAMQESNKALATHEKTEVEARSDFIAPTAGTVINPHRVAGLRSSVATSAQIIDNAREKAQADADRMERMAKPKRDFIPNISDAEKEHFASYDLRNYFMREGATYSDDKSKSKGTKYKFKDGSVGTAFELHWGEGQGFLAMEHPTTGEWTYRNRFDNERGNLVSYVMKRDGADYIEACRKLRDELGTHNLIDHKPTDGWKEREAERAAAERQAAQLTLGESFEKTLSSGYAKLQAGIDNVQRLWNDAKEGFSQYLALRKLDEDTQLYWRKDFRNEPEFQYDETYTKKVPTNNPGGVQFPMVDPEDLSVTGLSRKGPGKFNQGYGVAAKDSVKNLVIMTGEANDPKPQYILYGENQIDPMSLWQESGKRRDTWLVSSSGEPGERELAGLYKLAKDNPQATWVFVGQNDKASLTIQSKVLPAILEGNPEARIAIRRPDVEFNDWNDVLQNKKQSAEKVEQFKVALQEHKSSAFRPVEAAKTDKDRQEIAEMQRRMRKIEEERRAAVAKAVSSSTERPRGPVMK